MTLQQTEAGGIPPAEQPDDRSDLRAAVAAGFLLLSARDSGTVELYRPGVITYDVAMPQSERAPIVRRLMEAFPAPAEQRESMQAMRESRRADARDTALLVALRDWASVLCRGVAASRDAPDAADWWCPAVARCVAMHLSECGNVERLNTLIGELRGLDVDVIEVLDEIERVAGVCARERTMLLVGFVIAAWLDAPERDLDERAMVERLRRGRDAADAPSHYAQHAAFGINARDEDYQPQWVLWSLDSALDARWAATCVLRALGEVLDALDTDRRVSDCEDALAAFVREGDERAFVQVSTPESKRVA